ncbi:MAG: hypothetical protein EHM91_15415 [Planctomycetota bacterium]|nr:MAG: hypothetical protein EHM91_15415 [Planctomycetota bacterium]
MTVDGAMLEGPGKRPLVWVEGRRLRRSPTATARHASWARSRGRRAGSSATGRSTRCPPASPRPRSLSNATVLSLPPDPAANPALLFAIDDIVLDMFGDVFVSAIAVGGIGWVGAQSGVSRRCRAASSAWR